MVSEKEKLIWLGVKRSSQTVSIVKGEIQKLKDNVGDYSTFQTELDEFSLPEGDTPEEMGAIDGVTNMDEFKVYLQNRGFDQDGANGFASKVDNNFDGYSAFKTFVQEESEDYTGLRSKFGTTNSFGSELESEDGEQMAGMRTFDQAGVTRGGVEVPPGAVEVYGSEIHFSQSEEPKTQEGSGSVEGISLITVDNFNTSDDTNTVDVNGYVYLYADVTNAGAYSEEVSISLTEDGEVIDSKNVSVQSGETKTVEFRVRKTEYTCHDYQIHDTDPITVCWAPAGIERLV